MAKLSKKNEELLRAVKRQAGAGAKTSFEAKTDAEIKAGAEAKISAEAKAGAGSATGLAVSNNPTVGLGVDLLEIERMERALARTPRILERVFTAGEREYAWDKARPATHYAAFFAAREAVLKALGTGFSAVAWDDVEVAHDDKGKPVVLLHNAAHQLAEEQGITEVQISLSHTHTMAVANAVAIKPASRPQKNEKLDPLEELTRQFKELRSMLDNLEGEVAGVVEAADTADTADTAGTAEAADSEATEAAETAEAADFVAADPEAAGQGGVVM